MVLGSTRTLRPYDTVMQEAITQSKPIDEALPRPWRVALSTLTQGVTLIFDLSDTVILGRTPNKLEETRQIDLSPFNALDLGVSRQHAFLKLEKNRVYLIDNHSTNGVFLNNEALRPGIEYPVRHGDRIKLGGMSLRISFLTNPFRQ